MTCSNFSGHSDFYEENRWQKILRRLKEEPLVPLGVALTCAALIGATRSMRAGDRERTNRMFRARVYAQGFTVLAMVAGSVYWQTDRQKRKEFDKAVADRNAQEKRDAWVRELEARDEEEKELRAMREARRRGTTPSQTMEKAKQNVKDNLKKLVEEDWKEDPPEMQLGVANSTSENEKKGIMGSIHGMIWGSKK